MINRARRRRVSSASYFSRRRCLRYVSCWRPRVTSLPSIAATSYVVHLTYACIAYVRWRSGPTIFSAVSLLRRYPPVEASRFALPLCNRLQ